MDSHQKSYVVGWSLGLGCGLIFAGRSYLGALALLLGMLIHHLPIISLWGDQEEKET